MNRTVARLVMCTGVVALIACDPATTPEDQGVALWHLKGTITSAGEPSIPETLRFALLWYDDAGDVPLASAEVEVEATFPARFDLALTEPPPEIAMLPAEDYFDETAAGARVAFAYLMVYEDADGDGQAARTCPAEGEPTDRIWWFSDNETQEIVVMYLESTEPAATPDEVTLQPGPNLVDYMGGLGDYAVSPDAVELDVGLFEAPIPACELW